jgi:hypothetical protein
MYCKPNWKIFGTVVEGPKGYGVARKVSAIRSGNRGVSPQRKSVRFSLELARQQRPPGQITWHGVKVPENSSYT